ncbi:hypothetical protein FB451DRAFT_1362201 [Mycena latifolia]|nr:hypothetical protein FB451DRAFT_1362201 [Mycena latifolia]
MPLGLSLNRRRVLSRAAGKKRKARVVDRRYNSRVVLVFRARSPVFKAHPRLESHPYLVTSDSAPDPSERPSTVPRSEYAWSPVFDGMVLVSGATTFIKLPNTNPGLHVPSSVLQLREPCVPIPLRAILESRGPSPEPHPDSPEPRVAIAWTPRVEAALKLDRRSSLDELLWRGEYPGLRAASGPFKPRVVVLEVGVHNRPPNHRRPRRARTDELRQPRMFVRLGEEDASAGGGSCGLGEGAGKGWEGVGRALRCGRPQREQARRGAQRVHERVKRGVRAEGGGRRRGREGGEGALEETAVASAVRTARRAGCESYVPGALRTELEQWPDGYPGRGQSVMSSARSIRLATLRPRGTGRGCARTAQRRGGAETRKKRGDEGVVDEPAIVTTHSASFAGLNPASSDSRVERTMDCGSRFGFLLVLERHKLCGHASRELKEESKGTEERIDRRKPLRTQT